MSGFLNISYTLIGQITLPSVSSGILLIWIFLLTSYQFIAEMKNPKDFPKGKSEAWASYKCCIRPLTFWWQHFGP